MPFSQTTFAGASIRSFNGSVGWSDQPSTLTINLVEDAANGDSFVDPSIGDAASFNYEGWVFFGITQSWQRQEDFNGFPVYQVVLQDPRDVLSGAKIILAGYNSSVLSVPNLYNVYGYIEAVNGFGSAEVNAAGIKWEKVRDTLVTLTNNPSSYGGALTLRNTSYVLDLDALPNLPSYYRIAAEDMSIMDFVKDICDAANHDFYFYQSTIGPVNTIKLVTIDRNNAPGTGSITNFIINTPGAVQKNAGFELRNEVTSKFLVGGPLSQIYLSSPDGTQEAEDEPVWPYWGLNNNGDQVVVGVGLNDQHTMSLPSRWLDFWPYDNYVSDVGEIRAAEDSQESWETYLWLRNWNYYRFDENGQQTDIFRDPENGGFAGGAENFYGPKLFKGVTTSYNHSGEINPHFGKASILLLSGVLAADLALFLGNASPDKILKSNMAQWGAFTVKNFANAINNKGISLQEEAIQTVYDFVRKYATEYYGKKFMVQTPFMLSTQVSETSEILTTQDPVDSGFIEESEWDNAVANNLLPFDVNPISEPDGRILAYCRFDFQALDKVDLSGLTENQDYVLNQNLNSAFILSQVDKNLVYLDKDLLFSPRVVVTIPNAVRKKASTDEQRQNFQGVLADFLNQNLRMTARPGGAQNDATVNTVLNSLYKRLAADNIAIGRNGAAVLPDLVAVPLESNIQFYGPWYAIGANGPIEFEKDETLVPWNFGGFTAMNNSADARVISALSVQQISETGTVQYPDVPQVQLGGALIIGGPYITDVDVSIDAQAGATTTYNMATWTPHPFRLRKSQADFQTRILKLQQYNRRNLRERLRRPVRQKRILNPAFAGGRHKPGNKLGTSHYIIAGSLNEIDAGSGVYTPFVAIQPGYNSAGQIASDLTDRAASSLDGIFRPFSTDTASEILSHFESPVGGAATPNVSNLNPYGAGHDIQILTQDNGTLPDSYINERGDLTGETRGIGLRGPMVITGWGYDIDGNPVPSGADGNFITDYKSKSHLWKTGPVDLRWDDDRKVWTAPSGGATAAAATPTVSNKNDTRLTYVSGIPVYDDVLIASGLFLAAYQSNQISLYNGGWDIYSIPDSGLYFDFSTYNSGVYDVFAFLNVDTPQLTLSNIWTDFNTRSGELERNEGILVQSGDPTRRYLGTIFLDDDGISKDDGNFRYLYNYYNKIPRHIWVQGVSVGGWSAGGSIAEHNGGADGDSGRISYIDGVADVDGEVKLSVWGETDGISELTVGIDINSDTTIDVPMGIPASTPRTNIVTTGLLHLKRNNGLNKIFFNEIDDLGGAGTTVGDPGSSSGGSFIMGGYANM